jgi:hypothetical protein
VTPAYFFRSEAISGQAAIPESIANQPFVMGKGPRCMRRAKPPTPAMNVHIQATVRATTRPSSSKIDFRIFSLRLSRGRELTWLRWGLVPRRAGDPNVGRSWEHRKAALAGTQTPCAETERRGPPGPLRLLTVRLSKAQYPPYSWVLGNRFLRLSP